MLTADDPRRPVLVRRGFILEYLTLGWNVAGIVIVAIAAIAAIAARSVRRDTAGRGRREDRQDVAELLEPLTG